MRVQFEEELKTAVAISGKASVELKEWMEKAHHYHHKYHCLVQKMYSILPEDEQD